MESDQQISQKGQREDNNCFRFKSVRFRVRFVTEWRERLRSQQRWFLANINSKSEPVHTATNSKHSENNSEAPVQDQTDSICISTRSETMLKIQERCAWIKLAPMLRAPRMMMPLARSSADWKWGPTNRTGCARESRAHQLYLTTVSCVVRLAASRCSTAAYTWRSAAGHTQRCASRAQILVNQPTQLRGVEFVRYCSQRLFLSYVFWRRTGRSLSG